MSRLSEYTVAYAIVEFSDGTGAKKRPIVVLKLNEQTVTFFKITSKYWSKSEYIRAKYYKIKDWVYANLDRELWVDTITPIKVNESEVKFTIVGRFSNRDIKGLRDFLVSST